MYVRSIGIYAQGKHSVYDIQITGEFKFAIQRLGTTQLKKRNTFSIHFYNAGAPTFGGGLSPPANSAYVYIIRKRGTSRVNRCPSVCHTGVWYPNG